MHLWNVKTLRTCVAVMAVVINLPMTDSAAIEKRSECTFGKDADCLPNYNYAKSTGTVS